MSVVCDLLCETGFGVFRHGFAVEVAPNAYLRSSRGVMSAAGTGPPSTRRNGLP